MYMTYIPICLTVHVCLSGFEHKTFCPQLLVLVLYKGSFIVYYWLKELKYAQILD